MMGIMPMKAQTIILMALLCFAGACGPIYIPMSQPAVSEESQLFSTAERLFERRAYTQSLELYNEYLTRFPEGQSAPLALMREASINIELKKPGMARKLWQYLMDRYPESVFIPEARIGVLGTLYDEKAYSEMIQEGERFLKNIPTYHPKVRVLMGDAYLALRSPLKAIEAYSLAYQHAVSSEKEGIKKKLKAVIASLSDADISSLTEQSGYNPLLKGYLMYQSGLNRLKAEKYEEAVKVLSEFVEILPNHELVPEAAPLIKRFGKQPENKFVEHAPPITPSASQSRYKIGCLLPMSGTYSDYGAKALRGIEIAKLRAAALGYQIADIIVKDSGASSEQAVQAVRELDEMQVSAIIGPLTAAETAAVEARNRGIPIVMLVQKSNIDTGNYVFRHFMTPEMQVDAIASYAANAGIRTFAVLYPNEKYGTSFMGLFKQAVTARGGSVVETAAYPPTQTDFSASLKKLVKTSFEALFIPDSAKKVGLILPQLAFHDINNVRLFGTHLWHSDNLIRMSGQAAQGAVIPEGFFAESRAPHVADFVRNFQTAYREKPEFMEAIAYDTGMMLFQILGKPGTHSRNEVRDELLRLQHFQGVTGMTSFDAVGAARKKLYLLRVDGNAFTEIETP
jgi:ABC-type branched-subunit amino acid transport system substrate-binding protein/TolA-binding protein